MHKPFESVTNIHDPSPVKLLQNLLVQNASALAVSLQSGRKNSLRVLWFPTPNGHEIDAYVLFLAVA